MSLGSARSALSSALCRGASMLVLFIHPCWAGLDRYTELDRVNGWLSERKQGSDGALSCRAYLPSGASWFSGNIHLDTNGELVVPAGRSFEGDPKQLEAVRNALDRCKDDYLYLPLSEGLNRVDQMLRDGTTVIPTGARAIRASFMC